MRCWDKREKGFSSNESYYCYKNIYICEWEEFLLELIIFSSNQIFIFCCCGLNKYLVVVVVFKIQQVVF